MEERLLQEESTSTFLLDIAYGDRHSEMFSCIHIRLFGYICAGYCRPTGQE